MDVGSFDLRILAILFFATVGLGKFFYRFLNKRKWTALRSRARHASQLIDQVYPEEINPFALSWQYREENQMQDKEFTYGEVVVEAFAEVMYYAQPKKNELFYDLGCGAGRALFTAALCYPGLKVHGIEILPPMYDFCQQSLARFKELVKADRYFANRHFDIHITLGDFIDFDFSDGNIFLINATCLPIDIWRAIQKRLLALPIGVRIIVISRKLDHKAFELLEAGLYLVSWGRAALRVYQKVH